MVITKHIKINECTSPSTLSFLCVMVITPLLHVGCLKITKRQAIKKQSLSIKARGLDTRVSASRRVGSTPASQYQGAWAETRVSVITALVMGPVAAHIAGRSAPHCGAFLGGTFTP